MLKKGRHQGTTQQLWLRGLYDQPPPPWSGLADESRAGQWHTLGAAGAPTLGFPGTRAGQGGHPGAQHPHSGHFHIFLLSPPPSQEKCQLPRQAFIAQPGNHWAASPSFLLSTVPKQPKGQNEH